MQNLIQKFTTKSATKSTPKSKQDFALDSSQDLGQDFGGNVWGDFGENVEQDSLLESMQNDNMAGVLNDSQTPTERAIQTQTMQDFYKRGVVIKDCTNISQALQKCCENLNKQNITASTPNTNHQPSENALPNAKSQGTKNQNPPSKITPKDLDFRIQNTRFFITPKNPSNMPKPPILSQSLGKKPSFSDVVSFLDSVSKNKARNDFLQPDFTQSDFVQSVLTHSSTLKSSDTNPTKIEINQAQLNALFASPLYENPHFSITQICDLRVFMRDLEALFRLEIDDEKVDICFCEAFCVVEDRGFIEDFYEQVESALFAQGVILHTDEVRSNLSLILESIAKNPAKKKEIFCLLKSKNYTSSKKTDFVFLPQKEWETRNGASPQNAAFGVKKGAQIAILYKPLVGTAGRNLFGDFAQPKSIESTKLLPTKQADIDTTDTPKSIIYTAKKDGFIQLQNGEFRFIQIPRTAFSTRNVPQLLAGEHLDIEITCSDMAEDAIGAGVWCEVGNLKVRGCVAENTRIKAKTLIIEGSTHKSAHIKAYAAQIRTHKGKLECTHCAIENLDNGELIAHSAKILRANGAKIATDNATIHELKSNNTILFAKSCAILRNKGGQNELVFCASAGGGFAKWSKGAKAYFSTQDKTLKTLHKLADFWANKQGRASEFLEKMKGFSEYQKQIALKDEAYATKYREALAQANVANILQSKIKDLQNQILGVRNQAMLSLKNTLQKARLSIQEKWGYDNYAILVKPSMSVFESSKISSEDSGGFFSSEGLEKDFKVAFEMLSADNTLDKLELQEGQSGGNGEQIMLENFKLKVV